MISSRLLCLHFSAVCLQNFWKICLLANAFLLYQHWVKNALFSATAIYFWQKINGTPCKLPRSVMSWKISKFDPCEATPKVKFVALYLFWHLARFTLLNCVLLPPLSHTWFSFTVDGRNVVLTLDAKPLILIFFEHSFVSWIKDDWHHMFSILESNSL